MGDEDTGDWASKPAQVENWSGQEKGGIKSSYVVKWFDRS